MNLFDRKHLLKPNAEFKNSTDWVLRLLILEIAVMIFAFGFVAGDKIHPSEVPPPRYYQSNVAPFLLNYDYRSFYADTSYWRKIGGIWTKVVIHGRRCDSLFIDDISITKEPFGYIRVRTPRGLAKSLNGKETIRKGFFITNIRVTADSTNH